WYQRCEGTVLTGKPASAMYLDFPGFERAFQSVVVLNPAWDLNIEKELILALGYQGSERFERVLEVYSKALATLSRSQMLDVITCCLPPEVITGCWSTTRRLTYAERKQRSSAKRGEPEQLSFDAIWHPNDPVEALLQRDFRRALKARAMEANVPIQI